ncbi:serine/threonine protein kinase [Scytonema sp. PCC 10023]|uniref:serine/threonine protein kinase n=1 Tax=Scytonema sp. PCC 10023 TaxID=1680591 RepID=UPI0039C625F2
MAWDKGTHLQGGRYVIEKELGRGGSGITYLASRTDNGQSVAIKTVNKMVQDSIDFDKCQQEFENEARRLQQCTHPHIVSVHDLFLEGLLWCMVMEYISGETLASYVDKQGVLSEADALHYIRQIGEALIEVHKNGLLHRDVKPRNIMLRSNSSEAVLIDFGAAREFTHNHTQTHTEVVSQGFAPYEQHLKRHKRGKYSDVYATAATLYFMVTKKVPPNALERKEGEQLVPPKQLNRRISDRVNEAILKGMALEPSDRPQSIQQWLKLLEAPEVITPHLHVRAKPIPWQALKSILKAVQGWFRFLKVRLTLNAFISLKTSNTASRRSRAETGRVISYCPWLTGAFLSYALTGLLCAKSASPIWALTLANAGALAGTLTYSSNLLRDIAACLAIAVPYAGIGVSYLVVVAAYFAFAFGCLAVLLFLTGLVIFFVAAVLGLVGLLFGVGAEAEVIAKAGIRIGTMFQYWAWAIAQAVFTSVVKALAWVLAGEWVGIAAWAIGWVLAIACFLALAAVLAGVRDKLLKWFNKFHTFLILTITSGLGLWLGWLVHWKRIL